MLLSAGTALFLHPSILTNQFWPFLGAGHVLILSDVLLFNFIADLGFRFWVIVRSQKGGICPNYGPREARCQAELGGGVKISRVPESIYGFSFSETIETFSISGYLSRPLCCEPFPESLVSGLRGASSNSINLKLEIRIHKHDLKPLKDLLGIFDSTRT
jgi:hypothetical protein